MEPSVGYDQSLLKPDARVRFPGHVDVATILAVKSGPYWDFVYRGADGRPAEITLSEDELPQIEVVGAGPTRPFDADARYFRLGVEAHRIGIAFQHDMGALAVSNIAPLPHQLEAVYGHFLEQPRLRFLLGDDPGAGKTIMAGLYLKELQLRRAADRILIVTPASLRPQWQRELAERFHIDAVQFDSAVFDAVPTQNPWDVHNIVIVSRDYLRRPEVVAAFAQAEKDWDLAIVDEAHGFTLQVDGNGLISKRSDRYKAAEQVADKAHRLILLTATPHSGRTESLWGLLRLLDRDAYGDRCPKKIERISPRHYSKTSKEQMVDLRGEKLFRPRHPHTIGYPIEGAEWDLYRAVTNFVANELAEIRGQAPGSAAGLALTTMQRRLASSVRAIRRTIERRIDRLEWARDHPLEYLHGRREFRESLAELKNDATDLAEHELWRLEERALEEWLPRTDDELVAELDRLFELLAQATETEERGVERKLNELLQVVKEQGLRDDASKKLLIFTEHKDTLEYLVEKLSTDFEVAVIHGDLKLAERIGAERHFRERAQIMVATEAAGEGINLQFCHLMVNYDIPWNPNRLEQRMGRIHRIGQTQDVHIFNLVAANTREGRVLSTVLRKLERMRDALDDDRVFDVIGEILADCRLSDLLEAVVAGTVTDEDAARVFGDDPDEFDPEIIDRARTLLERALATRHIDWQAERDRAKRAEERRLPPDYLKRFFRDAIGYAGGVVEDRLDPGTLRVSRTPDILVARSRVGDATRRLAPEYARLTFEKSIAMRPPGLDAEPNAPHAELCGPGHPLFDALVDHVIEETRGDLDRGAVFGDPDLEEPLLLHVVTADAVDGNAELADRGLVTITETPSGFAAARRILYDLVPTAPHAVTAEDRPTPRAGNELEMWARKNVFEERYQRVKGEREHVAAVQAEFLTASFQAIFVRQDQEILTLDEAVDRADTGAEGRLRKAELAKRQTMERRDRRLAEANRGRQVTRGPVRVIATCLVVPGGGDAGAETRRTRPGARNQEVEQIAVRIAIEHERASGADPVRSVEADNVGFDLLSLRGIERRCIEVKGRAGVGDVELTWSEYMKAIELGADYWLYVVLDCLRPAPRLYRVQDPARTLIGSITPHLDVRFGVGPQPVIDASEI